MSTFQQFEIDYDVDYDEELEEFENEMFVEWCEKDRIAMEEINAAMERVEYGYDTNYVGLYKFYGPEANVEKPINIRNKRQVAKFAGELNALFSFF